MKKQEELSRQKSSQPVIHRSAWVITGPAAHNRSASQGIMENGALVVADGLVRAVGSYSDIAGEFGHFRIRDHGDKILAPALVNGHCHLELSHLDLARNAKDGVSYNGNQTVWIRDLLVARDRFCRDTENGDELILAEGQDALRAMADEGVAFVGDVGNSPASRTIGATQSTKVCFLLELLGLTRESEAKNLARLAQINRDQQPMGCTPHAPYSTTPALIQTMKKAANRAGRIISVHVAESAQEVEFLQSSAGPFRDFLMERGAWDGSFVHPGTGPVQYLDSLGVLDENTLCIHGVHVSPAEISLLAKRRAKVCLCPGSNRFLGVGKAPVTEYLDHGILPALGTDSKASNKTLSMWREMRLLREDHAGLEPATVFAMASRGGAEAWGVATALGTLAPGKRALILAVGCPERISAVGDVFEYLTTAGESVQAEWLER